MYIYIYIYIYYITIYIYICCLLLMRVACPSNCVQHETHGEGLTTAAGQATATKRQQLITHNTNSNPYDPETTNN